MIGGGLFPRTALALRRLFPTIQLRLIDSQASHLAQAQEVLAADVVVSAAGSSMWELLALGTACGMVAVAGNQLAALQTQQLADLTAAMAAIGRAQALAEAQRAAAQDQAREQTRRFLQPGPGYVPTPIEMFRP